ncbi:hypothetical protein CJ030_MR4G008609 [Morella rubra]|uniref:Uncharacterized protein n=1 Tax=Morella rubra TaxID=262757 RepID=A0A6A1W1H9_9ROSI|nr:hypothetical protein CJ030_MR4G008609 [Morella rubra]
MMQRIPWPACFPEVPLSNEKLHYVLMILNWVIERHNNVSPLVDVNMILFVS